jgi:chloramphenicol 3-O-phosphotransferase
MASGRIIFLNGSSSAGKTTLASTLQQLLDEPYQHIALDQFRDGLPGRYPWTGSCTRYVRAGARKVQSGLD